MVTPIQLDTREKAIVEMAFARARSDLAYRELFLGDPKTELVRLGIPVDAADEVAKLKRVTLEEMGLNVVAFVGTADNGNGYVLNHLIDNFDVKDGVKR